MGRPPQIQVNCITAKIPEVDSSIDNETWVAYYESSKGISPGAVSTTFKELITLCIIVNSTLTLFFSPTKVISGSILLDEYEKYMKWKERLPNIVTASDRPPPHVLCLHLLWHSAVLLLFRPFIRAKITDSDVVPQDVCRNSANSISELFAKHRATYDLAGICSFQIQCLMTACTIHILHMPAIASTTHFVDACNSLHDLMERNEWARTSLNTIKSLVKKWDRVLPIEAEAALYRDERMEEQQPLLPAMTADVRQPQQGFAGQDGVAPLSSPPEGLEKRSATAEPEVNLAKRLRLEEQPVLPALFAPSKNQPAPLVAPLYLPKEWQGVTKFAGLDFSSTDDLMNPFMGFEG